MHADSCAREHVYIHVHVPGYVQVRTQTAFKFAQNMIESIRKRLFGGVTDTLEVLKDCKFRKNNGLGSRERFMRFINGIYAVNTTDKKCRIIFVKYIENEYL